MNGDRPNCYHGYFENTFGEQLVFVYDRETGKAELWCGDAGWEKPFPLTKANTPSSAADSVLSASGTLTGRTNSCFLRSASSSSLSYSISTTNCLPRSKKEKIMVDRRGISGYKEKDLVNRLHEIVTDQNERRQSENLKKQKQALNQRVEIRKESKMKNLFAVLTILIVISSALLAGGQRESTEVETAQEVTLEIWQIKWNNINDWSDKIFKSYMAEFPNVKIKKFVSEEAGGYNVKLLTAIAGGEGPDVFQINAVTKGSYEPRGILAPLDLKALGFESVDVYAKDWVPGALDSFKSQKGELLGLPFDLAAWNMMINKAYFKDAGLDPVKDSPKTWNDFCATAVKLHKKDASGKTVHKGTQLPWGSPFGWYLISWEPMLWQYGGRVFDDNQMSSLDSEATRKAIGILNNIHNVYDTGDAPEFQGVSPVVDFGNGRNAMALGHMGSLGVIKSFSEEVFNNTDFIPMPQVNPQKPVGAINAWGYFINKNSKKKAESTKWIDYFVRSAAEDPSLTGGAFTPIQGYATSPEVKKRAGYDVAMAAIAYSRPREGTPYYDETGNAIKKALEDIVLMKLDMDKVIKALHEKVNRIQSGQ